MKGNLQEYIFIFLGDFIQYFIIGGIAFFSAYVIWKKTLKTRKIQKLEQSKQQIKREIKNSIISLLVMKATLVLAVVAFFKGYTTVYLDFYEHSIPYYFLSFAYMLFLHDTYFYWTHRLIHHPLLFKIIHKEHHKSKAPTPWAIFSFHPLEAVVLVGIIPILMFGMPLHVYAIIGFFSFSQLYNTIGHLGYEIFPNWFLKVPVLRGLISATYHDMHHEKITNNYGLYFRFWDVVMGTESKDYKEKFKKITSRKQS
jgi:lathosterol oxidase